MSRLSLLQAFAAVSLLAAPAVAAPPPHADPATYKEFGRVAFDRHSLLIDGQRKIIWSGEIHPFRLPSPDLWRDIMQKMKANGFNTIAFYFDWGYHSPKKGVYDFSGIRDIDRVLTIAAEEGLYVMTRAGPYVNAELSRGGFPGWLVNQSARARTDHPDYLAASDEWLSKINPIIARHQINNGKGTVILHQIENELDVVGPTQVRYMQHLYDKARADGITVPIFHNDKGRNGYWVPRGSGVPLTVEGPTDMYAFDGYPGGTCTVQGKPTRGSAAPDWGFYGPGGAKGGATASPNTPGFAAEFGGGWFDYWGSNGGYECNAIQRGKRFQRVFYGTNLANGIGIQSFYIAYGGTSWGWLAGPVVYTSYDYGAAISEPREVRPKLLELKQLGQQIAAVPDLAGMVRGEKVTASSPNIQVYHNRNPRTDARFMLVAHNPSNKQTDDSFTITADLPDGRYTFPQAGPMRLNGFDAKWLLAGINLQGQRLVYSSSELQTALRQDGSDIALFYGRKGEPGETVLRYASAPQVTVLEGTVSSQFDPARGDLRLNYNHDGLARVRISGGGRRPLLLLLADEDTGTTFWQQETAAGSVLERGPALVRTVNVRGGRLALTGDTAAPAPLEIWAPASVRSASWNGQSVALQRTTSGSLLSRAPLAGPTPFPLPALTNWRTAAGSPEASSAFDDSGWVKAAGAPFTATVRPPDGQPNLGMDAYGFHHGDVWYRGRFEGGPGVERIALHYGGGAVGLLQLWLDGKFIGQHELAGGLPRPITTGVTSFDLPPEARAPGEHVLSIMIRNNGHNWDLDADDFHKETRGLVSASLEAKTGPGFSVPIDWKIQGNAGGEDIADPVRGVVNNGGLFGERSGWHLPGFDDSSWSSTTLSNVPAPAGTTWLRTSFDLNVPKGQDATIALAFGDTTKPRSDRQYRVLMFVNGWNMGQFIAHVGPQRVFPIPEGILNHGGRNSLALAVTSDGDPANRIEEVRLVTMRNVKGGLPVRMVPAPATLATR